MSYTKLPKVNGGTGGITEQDANYQYEYDECNQDSTAVNSIFGPATAVGATGGKKSFFQDSNGLIVAGPTTGATGWRTYITSAVNQYFFAGGYSGTIYGKLIFGNINSTNFLPAPLNLIASLCRYTFETKFKSSLYIAGGGTQIRQVFGLVDGQQAATATRYASTASGTTNKFNYSFVTSENTLIVPNASKFYLRKNQYLITGTPADSYVELGNADDNEHTIKIVITFNTNTNEMLAQFYFDTVLVDETTYDFTTLLGSGGVDSTVKFLQGFHSGTRVAAGSVGYDYDLFRYEKVE